MRIRWTMIPLLLIAIQTSHAQYFGEQVMEKSFEKSDFFFSPNYLNPYGIGGFGEVAPGVLDELLVNMELNPAAIVPDTSWDRHYMYVDFRSSRDIVKDYQYRPYYGDAYYNSRYIPYPWYYATASRKAVEPVISAAYLFRPFEKIKTLSFGITYQMIIQDEKYYEIPTDIYKSNVGYDYNGSRMSEDASSIPITDRYRGDDEMHQEGHFMAVWTGFRILPNMDLGFRFAGTVFDREGIYGSDNLWDSWYHVDSDQRYYYSTARSQHYDHWDASAGLFYDISSDTRLGISGGLLKGSADQTMIQENESLYRNGTIGEGDNWSHYLSTSFNDQLWNHDGRTLFGGLQLETKIGPSNKLRIYYKQMRENVDITMAGAIKDTSYSNYYHKSDTWWYRGQSHSWLTDDRTGNGERTGLRHYAGLSLQMHVQPRTCVNAGLQYQNHDVKTGTVEHVLAARLSESDWANESDHSHYLHRVDEKKSLEWNFSIRSSKFQIPVMMSHAFSSFLDIQFGICRRITKWEITDVTLAVFDYRNKVEDDKQENKSNFGERYTQPREIRTDIATLLLGGITIKPSDQFNIRLLCVPQWTKTYEGTKLQEFQWWIQFNLFPQF